MDAVTLPLLRSDDTIDEAIEQMNSCERRFIVVEGPGGYRTFSSREVLQGWKAGARFLSDLPGGESVAGSPDFQSIEQLLRAPFAADGRDGIYRKLRDQQLHFAVAERPETGRVIRVATRSEDVRGEAMSERKVCVCAVCPHNGDSPPEPDGGRCPNCTNETWRCA